MKMFDDVVDQKNDALDPKVREQVSVRFGVTWRRSVGMGHFAGSWRDDDLMALFKTDAIQRASVSKGGSHEHSG